jgi:hypothetical protein
MSVTPLPTGLLTCSLLALSLAIGPLAMARAAASGHVAYRVNGVRFDVVTLTLAGDPRRIAGALASDWRVASESPRYPQQRGGTWVFGRLRGSLHETVELRLGHRPGVVEARVAVVDLAARPANAAVPPFRMPAGLRRLQVIEGLAGPEHPIVFRISSRVGVVATWSRLERAMAHAGFAAAARAPAHRGQESLSRVFEAHGAAGSVQGVIQPHAGGARVVLVHRRHPAGSADALR